MLFRLSCFLLVRAVHREQCAVCYSETSHETVTIVNVYRARQNQCAFKCQCVAAAAAAAVALAVEKNSIDSSAAGAVDHHCSRVFSVKQYECCIIYTEETVGERQRKKEKRRRR